MQVYCSKRIYTSYPHEQRARACTTRTHHHPYYFIDKIAFSVIFQSIKQRSCRAFLLFLSSSVASTILKYKHFVMAEVIDLNEDNPISKPGKRSRLSEDDDELTSDDMGEDEDEDNSKMNEEESARVSSLYQCVFRSELDHLVQQKNPEALQMLSELFPASKYPPMNKTDHCAFCCKSFDPRNRTSKCSLKHYYNDWKRTHKYSNGSEWSVSCACCGECYTGTSDSCDEPPDDLGEGYCYEGPHDSSDYAFETIMQWCDENYGKDEACCDICDERVKNLRK